MAMRSRSSSSNPNSAAVFCASSSARFTVSSVESMVYDTRLPVLFTVPRDLLMRSPELSRAASSLRSEVRSLPVQWPKVKPGLDFTPRTFSRYLRARQPPRFPPGPSLLPPYFCRGRDEAKPKARLDAAQDLPRHLALCLCDLS